MTGQQPQDGTVKLAAAVRCTICGTVPCATMEEADKRAETHAKVTRHPTVSEAVRVP